MSVPQVLVMADDLTGANAAAALYARRGLRTRTLVAGAKGDRPELGGDVCVVTTGSRHLEPRDAAERLLSFLGGLEGPGPQLLVKRVDTTLRGPIGAEIAAMLAYRRSRRRGRVAALAVPAYPAAHRTTLAGVQMIGGAPLSRSPGASAWSPPVKTSRVAELMAAGTDLTTRELHFDDIDRADAVLESALASALGTVDVTVADALSDGDLRRLATAASRARPLVGDIVVVDSGPFSAFYCDALEITPQTSRSPVLLVVGSPAPATQLQLEVAKQIIGTTIVPIDEYLSPGQLTDLAVKAIDGGSTVVGWHVPAHGGYIDEAWAANIPSLLAAATRQLVAVRSVGGLFACGGEVAAAVLEALDAQGLEVKTEIQPLVVAGRVVGGPWDRLPTVTKGGLVGDDNVITASISYLEILAGETHTMEALDT